MKLAIRKDEGSIPGGGFHYMLHPFAVEEGCEGFWRVIGYVVVDVPDPEGQRLLKQAGEALRHQVEVAFLCEKP